MIDVGRTGNRVWINLLLDSKILLAQPNQENRSIGIEIGLLLTVYRALADFDVFVTL
jgi:hypothetical protein